MGQIHSFGVTALWKMDHDRVHGTYCVLVWLLPLVVFLREHFIRMCFHAESPLLKNNSSLSFLKSTLRARTLCTHTYTVHNKNR